MDKKLDTLYDLCEIVSKELEEANEKIKGAGGEVSGGDIEFLDRLTHILKSLKTTIAMMESEYDGYSGTYWEGDGGRGNSYARRGTYSRGNRTYARGNRGGSYARGRSYGREDSREDFMEEIEELMEKAPDEITRRKFEKMLNEMK